ncbi:hypothetical protein [Shimia haliotis]|uniref:hypothetical protein n=1 Tax=Shimia haliotis TaxID=1280847 RepID=UPI00147E323E|nr:hypothetical protein [Shimia haliotis]
MKHIPASELGQSSRFSRLFELIRQENLRADNAEEPVFDQRDFVNDFLLKSASASLRAA